ncbi:MAG: adenosylmethionine decarboxylase [Candidatus Woesearchaeota archaeon]|nr:adenosylmethionine decarboxylase [Candidatus Woesearchaeota archaeon]
MTVLGHHLLVELYDCDVAIINDVKKVEEALLQAAEAANATVIQPVFHKFNPHGVSGVVVIAESHISIHTWPEHGYCALDIFTCGSIEKEKAIAHVQKIFNAKKTTCKAIERGVV